MLKAMHLKVIKIITHIRALESHIIGGDITVDSGYVYARTDLGVIHSEALYFFHVYISLIAVFY
jgi:hypothetical protein